MAHPYHHALSSVKKWGGVVEDYLSIHAWFDESKAHFGDFRHRAMRHHSQGIFEAERVFGVTIRTSDGREIPVRWIGEQHVIEDCGFIPSIKDWCSQISPAPWMARSSKLSKILEEDKQTEMTSEVDTVSGVPS